jgi:hypothetical protein
MRFSRKVTILVCVLVVASASALLRGAGKSNFSGSWKLDLAKSNLGPLPPPSSMTEKIEHHDPDLTVRTIVVGGPQGDLNYQAKYTTDGKESRNQFGDQTARSVMTWDGEDLVVTTKANFGGGDVTIKGRWSLSSDGKTLKQVSNVTSAQGTFETTYVFEKE